MMPVGRSLVSGLGIDREIGVAAGSEGGVERAVGIVPADALRLRGGDRGLDAVEHEELIVARHRDRVLGVVRVDRRADGGDAVVAERLINVAGGVEATRFE
jgi:hypothetical protein